MTDNNDTPTDGAARRERMAAAMTRLHEIDRAYPRIESRLKDSPTVLESDQEWLTRTKVDAVEWRRLWSIAKGERQ